MIVDIDNEKLDALLDKPIVRIQYKARVLGAQLKRLLKQANGFGLNLSEIEECLNHPPIEVLSDAVRALRSSGDIYKVDGRYMLDKADPTVDLEQPIWFDSLFTKTDRVRYWLDHMSERYSDPSDIPSDRPDYRTLCELLHVDIEAARRITSELANERPGYDALVDRFIKTRNVTTQILKRARRELEAHSPAKPKPTEATMSETPVDYTPVTEALNDVRERIFRHRKIEHASRWAETLRGLEAILDEIGIGEQQIVRCDLREVAEWLTTLA